MNAGDVKTASKHVTQHLRERCASFGIVIWRCRRNGTIVERPAGFGDADAFFGSSTMTGLVARAVNSWGDGTATPSAQELLPGCRLLPPCRTDSDPGAVWTVAMALGPSVTQSGQFRLCCNDAGACPVKVAHALECVTSNGGGDPDPRVIRWAHEAFEQMLDDKLAIADLSGELANAYEQISMLYRFGRTMNCLDDASLFVISTCNQLFDLLNYRWVAVQYVQSPLVDPALESRLLVAGVLPCPQEDFAAEAKKTINAWAGDQWTTILEPGRHRLADLASGHVLIEPVVHDDVVIGAVLVGNKYTGDSDPTSMDIQLLDVAADLLGVFHQNAARFETQRRLFMGTVTALTAAIDAKDAYTGGHSERVAMLAAQLARATGRNEDLVERIYLAGIVHDVGKIGVPEAVLGKPGKLTDEEFELIKRHPVIGHEILRDVPTMDDLLPGVLHHHEHWNGKGYPHGLAGEAIPLFGRIIAVADAFDAMSSDRAYRARMPREQVLGILRDGAGTQWDAALINVFMMLDFSQYDELISLHVTQHAKAA